MGRLWLLARTYWVDALIVAAAIEAAVEVAVRADSPRAPHMSAWLAAPVVALIVLTLLGRRRLPFAAPMTMWLMAAGVSFADGRLVVFGFTVQATGMVASLLLGHLRDAAQRRVGLAVVVGCTAIVVYNDPTHAAGDLIFAPVLFAIAWLAGYALHERAGRAEAAEARATQAEREREAAARIAVAEERARIAREIHDVVAHAVSVMVLHVGAVRHRLPESLAEDAEALKGVEQTGRTALAEMRRALGVLRQGDGEVELAPQPGLGRLPSLVEEVRRAGLPVHLQVDGDPVPLPHGIDLSAYRIVQEGLTNALKHAGAGRADVVVRFSDDQLQIDVHDDGRGAVRGDGLGHGLVGVRERVKLYGGEMQAGAVAGGGFRLSTRLPLEGYGR